MSYQELFAQRSIAISISDSSDISILGLSTEHLKDAMTEIARHLLALGSSLVYGGDLRENGFSDLLFELVARHSRDSDDKDRRSGVRNYLAWPVHINMRFEDIKKICTDLEGSAEVICLDMEGHVQPLNERCLLSQYQSTQNEWENGLHAMRATITKETHSRIILGGSTENFKGNMPGLAEEALFSIKSNQPLYILGGFGGCARDIAEKLKIVEPWNSLPKNWKGIDSFRSFSNNNLNNGLTADENIILAKTPHIDQAIGLILKGLASIK